MDSQSPRKPGELELGLRNAGFVGPLVSECPLAPLTTWRIGGPAELLAVPRDRDDLRRALRWSAEADIPYRVMGNGSNLLVSDEGVRGVVLRIRRALDRLRLEGTSLHAGAGAFFPAVARRASAAGLAGLEFGAGIPGTLAGAIVMNAGWHEHEIGACVERVETMEPDGAVRRWSAVQSGFGYRSSRFRGGAGIVLCATLRLRPDDPEAITKRLNEFAESRKANQPTDQPSCGSVFLKPPGDFAGRLIDRAGLKGLRVGDVEVSRKHANFIVNLGAGRARDVLELVRRVEEEVERRFGVRLEREFELW